VSILPIVMAATLAAPAPPAPTDIAAQAKVPFEETLSSAGQQAGPVPRKLPKNVYVVVRGRSVTVYDGHGRRKGRMRGHTTFGSRLSLRAVAQSRNLVKVRLPSRNNRQMGWVRTRDVTLHSSHYVITIELRSRRLTVRKDNRRIARFPVGIGRPRTPTPTGEFTITDIIAITQPHSAYGPYAFVLSAYSKQLPHFMGGRGQIGLHGTNQPKLLRGNLSRRVSHGCIRMYNHHARTLARLLDVGTPVNII
jgi:lipoprotein-anchoring transpeptidase ErfK/SrfK